MGRRAVSAATGESGAVSDFMQFLMAKTLVGQAQERAIHVPFRTHLLPVDETAGEIFVLDPQKYRVLVTVTEDLLRDSSRNADRFLRDRMVDALVKKMDEAFLAEIGDAPFYMADDGGINVDMSRELTEEQYLHGLVTFRLERTIAWKRR